MSSTPPAASTPFDVAKPDAPDATALQYPSPVASSSPSPPPTRPIISIITDPPTHVLSAHPDSALSTPFSRDSVSDTSSASCTSPDTPVLVPRIHRRDTVAADTSPTTSLKSAPVTSPPVIPSLLPDVMPLSRTSSGSSIASSWSSASAPIVPPSSSLPVRAPAPYLHPHTQSYAALASASSSTPSLAAASQLPPSRKRGASVGSDPGGSSPTAAKRRRMWVHTMEKNVFTPEEIASLPAPVRRTIYTSSLEAHIDKLHNQLLTIGLFPVPFEKLNPYHGLNSKTAKSMVAGLHRDMTAIQSRLAALRRAEELRAQAEQRELERNARPISQSNAGGSLPHHHYQSRSVQPVGATDEGPLDGDVKPRRSYVYPDFENGSSRDGLKRDIVS